MAFVVSEADWNCAEHYLSGKPNGTKLSRKERVDFEGVNEGHCHNSFIIFDGTIYALAREYLGKGTYSKVKLGQDRKKGLYAIKIQNGPGSKKNTYDHIEREVEQDLNLFITSGKRVNSEKTVYIVKYLGTELIGYLNSYETLLPITEIISIFIQCLTQIAQLHRGEKSISGKKYLHRDIKLDNFVINDQGQISLIDFGFSCPMPDDEYVDLKSIGTDDYIAPEIYSKQIYSIKTEVYALGALLEEMSSSIPALRGDYIIWQLHRAMRDNDPKKRPDIPTVIDTLRKWISNKESKMLRTALKEKDPASVINQQDLLCFAVSHGLEQEVAQCLTAGADVNKKNKSGRTPLMEAVRIGRGRVMTLLLNHPQLDFSAKDLQGKSAEHYAQEAGFYEQLISVHQEIIKNRVIHALQSADPKAEIIKYRLLDWTFYYQDINDVLLCLDAGGKVTKGWLDDVNWLLFWGLEQNHSQLFKSLLENGVDANVPNEQGKLPIDFVVEQNNVSKALILAFWGARLTAIAQAYFLANREKVIQVLSDFHKSAQEFSVSNLDKLISLMKQIIQLYSRHLPTPSLTTRIFGFFATPNIQVKQVLALDDLLKQLNQRREQLLSAHVALPSIPEESEEKEGCSIEIVLGPA